MIPRLPEDVFQAKPSNLYYGINLLLLTVLDVLS